MLLSEIENEADKSVLSEMLISLADCITTLGMNSLNEQQMQELIRVLDLHLTGNRSFKFISSVKSLHLYNNYLHFILTDLEHFQRASERILKRQDEDFDDDVEEELNDEVSFLVSSKDLQFTIVFLFPGWWRYLFTIEDCGCDSFLFYVL